VLLGPSLKGPTSISLLQLYQGYIFVPHWCLVLWTPFHHLGWKRWFSLFPLPLLVPSLHGLMSISLLWFEEGYSFIPHWCWEGAPPFLGMLLVVNAFAVFADGPSGFHPVLLCYLYLPSMDPPQWLASYCSIYFKRWLEWSWLSSEC
jgi:hypothetical protein